MSLKSGKAFVLALLCIVSWSFIPVVSKVTTQDISSLQMLFLSNVLSAMVIGVVLVWRRKHVPGLILQIRSNIFTTAIPGFLGCFLYYLCLYYGYSRADGVAVLVVQYLWPVLIVLLAPLVIGEALALRGMAAVLIGFSGAMVVATKGELTRLPSHDLPVLTVVLIGAFSFALFSLLSKRIKCDAMVATFLFFVWATLFSLIAVLGTDGLRAPTSGGAWLGLGLNGCLINGISYFWWLRALQLERSSRLAPLVFLTPILACLWLVLFLGEPFFMSYVVGLGLCASAGLLASRMASSA
jgi:drug/metabolite transporter (DMT)-like permease